MNSKTTRFLVLFALLFLSAEAVSQRRGRGLTPPPHPRGSVQAGDSVLLNDSLANDTLPADTASKKEEGLDAPVMYEANDSIVFTQNGYAHLFGESKVTYPGVELTAAVITMNMGSGGLVGQQERDACVQGWRDSL